MCNKNRVLGFAISFAVLLVCPLWLQAQDGNADVVPAETDVAAPIESVGPAGERIIYIPFKDLSDSFRNAKSDVVLPYAEYQAMLEAWKKQQLEPSGPAAVITSADYRVRIDGELARISATLKVKVMGKPWVWLSVNFGDAAVSSVEGENVLLSAVRDGVYELWFESSGDQTVTLEMGVPVSQSPDGRQFAFATPPVPVTTLEVIVPQQGQTIEVAPQMIKLPVEEKADGVEDATRLKANVGATERIAVRWSPQASMKPEMDLLTSVNNQTLVNIEDGLVHTDVWLSYDILRGAMDECRIRVPKGERILDVSALVRIKNWKVVDDGNSQILHIEFLTTVEKPVVVEIHTERKLESDQIIVGGPNPAGEPQGIHALDVVRESGQLAIRHSPDLNLTTSQQQGVVRIEAADVASRLKGQNALTYKFYSPEFVLSLNVKPVEPRLMVEQVAQFTFEEDELRLVNEWSYNIQRAGVFELRFKLPDDLTIDQVRSPQLKEFNVDNQAGELVVTLSERTLGKVSLTVTAHRALETETSELRLPLLEPMGVERETGSIFVYARDSMEVITDRGQLEGVQPLSAIPPSPPNVSLNSAWSFSRRPVTVPVRTKRKPTRISAKIATTIDVQPEMTEVRTVLDYFVEYAGLKTFSFEVPEGISESLQIEIPPGDQASAPIQQRTAGEAVDGWVTWTVVTQRDVQGHQKFLVTYDLKDGDLNDSDADSAADTDEAGKAKQIQLIRPLGILKAEGNTTTPLSEIYGEIVLKKERSLSISAEATGGGMELIDLRELKLVPQAGTLAYRYFNSAVDDRPVVSVSQSRHEIQEVVSTVVSRGLVEIVAGEDAEATYRGRFRVKTTERQRLLVYLPVNLEVLGTFLNDREVKLEKAEIVDAEQLGEDWTPFWINVARPESSDQAFMLTFQFLWKVNPSLGGSTFGRGLMSLPLPVLGLDASAVVQELRVVLWVPDKYSLVGDPDDFHLQTQQRPAGILLGEVARRQTEELDGWIASGSPQVRGIAQFPTEGRVPYVYTNLGGAQRIQVHWWNLIMITTIVSIAVGLIGWVLMKTSWENKLGMILIAAFAAAVYGLTDSHALNQGLYAARFGIALLLGLWLLDGVFSLGRLLQPKSSTTTPALAAASTSEAPHAEHEIATPSTPTENPSEPPESQ